MDNPFTRASEALLERGWTKGVRERDGRMCLVGAVAFVTTGNAWCCTFPREQPAWREALQILRDVNPCAQLWNDFSDRKESDVHALLAECALIWKERHGE